MGQFDRDITLFASLPKAERRWKSIVGGFAAQSLLWLGFVMLMFLAPTVVKQHYRTTQLVAPSRDFEPRKLKPVPKIAAPKPLPVRIPRPAEVEAPHLVEFNAPKVPVIMNAPKPELKKQVELNKFETVAKEENRNQPAKAVQNAGFGASKATTSNAHEAKVQTGGFGDEKGALTSSKGSDKNNIARLGSFGGTHAGEGIINGGARGTATKVGSSFGTASAAGNSGAKGAVQSTSFGTATAAKAAAQPKVFAKQAPTTPAEIKAKPRPLYTEEARRLGLEGEVVMQVVFSSEGKVQVVRVLHGLGHGLDEAAIIAAQGIRFIPAQRNGQAVDSTATLRIVFQLS